MSGARATLKTGTGLTLAASGAILLFAVRSHLNFFDLQSAGLVFLVTGLAWLCIPVQGKRAILQRQLSALKAYLDQGAELVEGVPASLADLLEHRAGTAVDGGEGTAPVGQPN